MVRYKIYTGLGPIEKIKLSGKGTIARGFGSITTARAACYKMIWGQWAQGHTYYLVYDNKNRLAGVAYPTHKVHRGSFWVDPDNKCYTLYSDGSLGAELR